MRAKQNNTLHLKFHSNLHPHLNVHGFITLNLHLTDVDFTELHHIHTDTD